MPTGRPQDKRTTEMEFLVGGSLINRRLGRSAYRDAEAADLRRTKVHGYSAVFGERFAPVHNLRGGRSQQRMCRCLTAIAVHPELPSALAKASIAASKLLHGPRTVFCCPRIWVRSGPHWRQLATISVLRIAAHLPHSNNSHTWVTVAAATGVATASTVIA